MLTGLLILPAKTDVGVVTVAFFGMGGMVATSTLLRKRRQQTQR